MARPLIKGTSFVASCVAAHSVKCSTSTRTMSSSSRWPVMPVTFGEGVADGGSGDPGGVVTGAGDAATPGVEIVAAEGVAAPVALVGCALAVNKLAANISDNRRNARNSECVALLFMVFLPSGGTKILRVPGEVTIGDGAAILIAGM